MKKHTMKRSLQLILFCLVLFPELLFAQPSIQWQRAYGGTDYDEPEMILRTPDKGFIVAGTAVSSDGDVGPNFGYDDCWVLKLDSLGQIVWKSLFGGSDIDYAFSMQLTRDGGSIIAGFTRSNDGTVSGNHGFSDAWVVKLDAFGSLQWQKCYGGSGREEAWDIKQTPDGGYVFAGQSGSTDGDVTVQLGGQDYWVVKLDSAGSIEWQKSYGGSITDLAYAIEITEDGGYIVAGESYSPDGDITHPRGNADYWVIKLNAEGKKMWQKSLGGGSLDRANEVLEVPGEGYVIFGQSFSNSGDVTGAHGKYDYWVVKLDLDGNILWKHAYGGSEDDFGRTIAKTHDGGFVAIGSSRSLNGDVTGNHGSTDIWITRLDSDGELLWQLSLGGSLQERGASIQPLNDHEFILCGYAWSNNGDVTGVQGKNDYWIVKLAAPSSSTFTPAPASLMFAPNPARDRIQLLWPPVESDTRVRIIDALGRVHTDARLDASGGLDVSGLPRGVYWVEALGAVGKLVKE